MAPPLRKRASIERWLNQSAVPVYVVAADRKLVYFNQGCEQLTGFRSEEVLGQVCHFASHAGADRLAEMLGTLCPPEEVFRGEEQQQAAYILPKEGTALPRVIQFYPLHEAGSRVTSILALVLPIKPPSSPTATSPVLHYHAALTSLRSELRQRYHSQQLVASSPALQRVLQQLDLATQNRCSVLLKGPAGTGKEHLARLIHYAGPLKSHWFVPLDCQALDAEELHRVLERLLEVHYSPLAPGAGRPLPGTVYLANIEHLPRDLQQRLADVLTRPPRSDGTGLRFLAGSTLDVLQQVQTGTMRSDLAARITTLTIELPPLAQRGADIPLLAQYFLEELNRRQDRQLTGLAPEVLTEFQRYPWPGNLDELQLVIQQAAEVARESQIQSADLPFRFRAAQQAFDQPPPSAPRPLPLDDMLQRVETSAIQLALERCKFNKSQAAELLGIQRTRLYRRMEQLGITDRESADEEKSAE